VDTSGTQKSLTVRLGSESCRIDQNAAVDFSSDSKSDALCNSVREMVLLIRESLQTGRK
jgi:hypothetical protein